MAAVQSDGDGLALLGIVVIVLDHLVPVDHVPPLLNVLGASVLVLEVYTMGSVVLQLEVKLQHHVEKPAK